MSVRKLLLAATILCAAAVTPVAAQEARHSAVVPMTGPSSSSQLGPRVTAPFETLRVRLPENLAAKSTSAEEEADGQHTIVISTLALVLGIIVIVLLVAR